MFLFARFPVLDDTSGGATYAPLFCKRYLSEAHEAVRVLLVLGPCHHVVWCLESRSMEASHPPYSHQMVLPCLGFYPSHHTSHVCWPSCDSVYCRASSHHGEKWRAE